MSQREALLMKQIVYRPPHYHRDFPLIVLWSHRAGCTTLAKWFFYQIGMLDAALNYNPWIHAYEFDIYKRGQAYSSTVLDNMLHGKKTVVKLVRDPFKRAVSSFLLLAITEDKQFDAVRARIAGHPIVRGLPGRGVTFRKYLTYLLHTGADVGDIDPHLACQYVPGEEQDIKRYLRLERLAADIRQLERDYGLKPANIAMFSKSEHHLSGQMRYTGAYADANVLDPRFPRFPLPASFYDSGTEALVRAVFRKDFLTYGYPLTRS